MSIYIYTHIVLDIVVVGKLDFRSVFSSPIVDPGCGFCWGFLGFFLVCFDVLYLLDGLDS